MKFDPHGADDPWYPCENCENRPLEKLVVPGCTTMWHCPKCHLFQKGIWHDGTAYGIAYHSIYEPFRQRKLRSAAVRLSRIARFLDRRRPKMLDIGCSLGSTVEEAMRRGWDAHGVDISEDAVDYCRDRGLSCASTRGTALPYPDETFDVITAWHVIEHVWDVEESLAEWHRVLKRGGLLAIETPNSEYRKVKWLGRKYRRFWKAEHVYSFNRGNLESFLRRAGFEMESPPWMGDLREMSRGMAAYAFAYQTVKGGMRLVTNGKAFQCFCRRAMSVPGQAEWNSAA